MANKVKCVLNNEGVLTGYAVVDASTLQLGDVAFDAQPDLPLGKYRWNGERFDPVDLGQVWFTPEGPDAWYAVYRALVYLQLNHPSVDFPEPTKEWLRYYHNAFRRQNDPVPPPRGQ